MALSPALTEALFFLLPDSQIIARTQVCNYPPAALHKPVVNSYPLSIEQVLSLKPDIIFTEEGMTSSENIATLRSWGITVRQHRYRKVIDVLDTLQGMTNYLNAPESAQYKIDSLKAWYERLEQDSKKRQPIKALCIISNQPVFAYGQPTVMTDMLRLAGAVNAVDSAFSHPYPELSREYLLQLDPDVVFGEDFAAMEAGFFARYPELKSWKAYKNKQVFALNADLATRPSPRILEAVEEIKANLPVDKPLAP